MPDLGDPLSQSQEDYLETLRSIRTTGKAVRVRDIASLRGVSMPSVVSALKRLADMGMVHYRAHEYVELTPEGERMAERVGQRHSFLRIFLEKVLLVGPDVASRDACVLEHALSLETLDRIAGFYQFLTTCKDDGFDVIAAFRESCASGPVPDEDTEAQRCGGAVRIREEGTPRRCDFSAMNLRPGQRGRVVGLRARPEVRRKLVEIGFLPGAEVALEARGASGQNVRLKLQASTVALPEDQAAAIIVDPEGR